MKSRRYFLIQGGLATTAMLALKPLSAFARITSTFTGISSSNNKLAFLHTANLNFQTNKKVIQFIKDNKYKNANTILLNAGKDIRDETGSLTYDASINGKNELSVISGEYKIINKGNIRTGIISAKPEENNVIQKIKTLSNYLKKEKNCTVVVCLSQLGYKNKNTPDDITLANKSTHLDIIIGGHSENFPANPVIALNSNSGEVIIHSASGDTTAFGKIEIDFDEQGRKKYISFNNHSSNNNSGNHASKVA